MISTHEHHDCGDITAHATRRVPCVEVSDMRRVLTSVLVAGLLMTAGAGAQQRPQDIKL